jgi:hypothetical protein
MALSRWLEVLNVPILFSKSQAMSQAGRAGPGGRLPDGSHGIHQPGKSNLQTF